MQDRSRGIDLRWQVLVLVCVMGFGLVMVFRSSAASNPERVATGPEPQQEVLRLETRINQLEQRFYGIETTIRTLEQQSRLEATSRGGAVSAQDLALLQSQIQALQLRLAEDECGLARLDERTLSQAMRNARRQSAGRTDPCRTNVESPLRLPETR
jgi:predicted RNase H-like nuclease (RuvC/YqgF family)